MRKLLALAAVTLSLTGCSARQTKPPPLPQAEAVCPAWADATASPQRKRQLAAELRGARPEALWPDVVLADAALKDQLRAAGCKPVNTRSNPTPNPTERP